MAAIPPTETFDAVVSGSGFGGSVSAMRLTEKGYRVLVLERGKRYRDQDFARTNWNIWKYLWLPAAALLRHSANQPLPAHHRAARVRAWAAGAWVMPTC